VEEIEAICEDLVCVEFVLEKEQRKENCLEFIRQLGKNYELYSW